MMDIMLDIETLGLKPGSIVVSVGAVSFDRSTGKMGSEFYSVIDINDSEQKGLTIEAGTAGWWLNQSEDARKVFSDETMRAASSLEAVSAEFQSWGMGQNMPRAHVWAQGDMDFQVWGAAMDAVSVVRPWAFWKQKDTRTAYEICGFDAKSVERDGVYHNALDDAKHQVRCLHLALASGGLV